MTANYFFDIHKKILLFNLYDVKTLIVIIFIIFLYLLNIFFSKFVKIINLLIKTSYIKVNIYLTMNLKERGITVGDLLILIIIIFSTTILVKSINKDKKTTLNLDHQENLSLYGSFIIK
tara:strand:+ start:289 stop:645 length:357 start_codon:yes stop_codon:yes gene_type:complete